MGNNKKFVIIGLVVLICGIAFFPFDATATDKEVSNEAEQSNKNNNGYTMKDHPEGEKVRVPNSDKTYNYYVVGFENWDMHLSTPLMMNNMLLEDEKNQIIKDNYESGEDVFGNGEIEFGIIKDESGNFKEGTITYVADEIKELNAKNDTEIGESEVSRFSVLGSCLEVDAGCTPEKVEFEKQNVENAKNKLKNEVGGDLINFETYDNIEGFETRISELLEEGYTVDDLYSNIDVSPYTTDQMTAAYNAKIIDNENYYYLPSVYAGQADDEGPIVRGDISYQFYYGLEYMGTGSSDDDAYLANPPLDDMITDGVLVQKSVNDEQFEINISNNNFRIQKGDVEYSYSYDTGEINLISKCSDCNVDNLEDESVKRKMEDILEELGVEAIPKSEREALVAFVPIDLWKSSKYNSDENIPSTSVDVDLKLDNHYGIQYTLYEEATQEATDISKVVGVDIKLLYDGEIVDMTGLEFCNSGAKEQKCEAKKVYDSLREIVDYFLINGELSKDRYDLTDEQYNSIKQAYDKNVADKMGKELEVSGMTYDEWWESIQ